MRITYGYSTPDTPIAADEFPGGCEVTDLKWHCADCNCEWGSDGTSKYCKTDSE